MRYDIIIIGGGSAGYASANFAQRIGAKVAIIDPGPLGGLCILRGCMPSKAILRSAEVISIMRRAEEFGLLPVDARANLCEINNRKRKLIKEFADYRIGQLKSPRFDLFEEHGKFVSPHEVRAGKNILTAKHIIVAAGTVTGHYDIPGLAETDYVTSDQALEMRQLPKSMIVLGAGPVAVELAQFFQRVGTCVTLIQRSRHILSNSDEDLVRPLEACLLKEGMVVYTRTRLIKANQQNGERTVHFEHEGEEKSVTAEVILQALGRKPNTFCLNLSSTGIRTDHQGYIIVDDEMRSNVPHIFSVGDINGRHEVVHSAIRQGEIVAHNTRRSPCKKSDDRLRMTVVFTDPQVASVGWNEKECRKKNIPYLSASYPFSEHGKSLCLGETHGHVKLICKPKTGEIIGGHIVGPEAGELIHELVAIMHYRGTIYDLLDIPHYHPTLAEIITYPAEELAEKILAG